MDIKISANVNVEITNVEADSIRDILKYAENESKNQVREQFHRQMEDLRGDLEKTREERRDMLSENCDLRNKIAELERQLKMLKDSVK